MRVLVCPTAFKGTIGAAEAAAAVARGVREAAPDADVREMPLSDGGPGLLDAIQTAGDSATGEAGTHGAGTVEVGPVEEVVVTGPLGGAARARILWAADGTDADVAVLESADACGLGLVAEGEEDALAAHTFGVGELVRAALVRGAGRVVVGLGGSATTDGGTGLARAFGYRFLDEEGAELPPGGGALSRLERILPGRSPSVPITALADVATPMSGAAGAARTYGPQKGATAEELERLVAGLERLSDRLERDLGAAGVGDLPGSGAAGGLGAGMAAFLGAGIEPGAAWVLQRAGFDEALAASDLLVTGEGAWDPTSGTGKVTGEVLRRAGERSVPALLVCGRVEGEVPEGVAAADADGERLDPAGLARLTATCLQRRLGRS